MLLLSLQGLICISFMFHKIIFVLICDDCVEMGCIQVCFQSVEPLENIELVNDHLPSFMIFVLLPLNFFFAVFDGLLFLLDQLLKL